MPSNNILLGVVIAAIVTRHKTLSLKIPYVEFDFDVSDCMMQVVTDTSKISMRPYNSVQMSNST